VPAHTRRVPKTDLAGVGDTLPFFDESPVPVETISVARLDPHEPRQGDGRDPIKAGRAGRGKMKTGYFWPIYGQADEVCFSFFPSRSHEQGRKLLGLQPAADAVLITDGYEAYHQTSAASRARKSSGSNTTWVVPSRYGVFSR